MWRCLAVFMACTAAYSADWQQFRGPLRDGSAPDFQVPTTWPTELKQIWSIQAGAGLASPLMSAERVFVFTREKGQEVLSCYAVADGTRLWRSAYDAPFAANAQATGARMFPASKGEGPFATPILSGQHILTLGVGKILSCFKIKDGALVWQKPFYQVAPPSEKHYACPPCNSECCKKSFDQPGTCPDCRMTLTLLGQETTTVDTGNYYGAAGSPLIFENKGVIQVRHDTKGELICFDLKDGSVLWSHAEPMPASVSPILANFAGVAQIVDITRESIESLSLDGKLLWRLELESNAQVVTPVAFEDLLIYAPYRGDLQAIRVSRGESGFSVAKAWESEHPLLISTPILVGDSLIGMDMKKRGRFFALDAHTGKTLWIDEGNHGDSATLLHTRGTVAALTSAGELLFLEKGEQGWHASANYTVASSPTWAHPVLWENKIIVKDELGLQLFKL